MDSQDIFRILLQAQEEGRDVALATVIRTSGSVPRHAGSKLLVWPDGSITGTVGGGEMESLVVEAGLRAMAQNETQTLEYRFVDPSQGDVGICGGTVELFVEPVLAQPTVLVIGCGHCGKALAELAKWTGYRVVVSDDRAELCSPENIPGMDRYIVGPPGEIVQQVKIHSQTYVAAMTRGQSVDLAFIPALLDSPARYLGVIGSRRRWALTADALREQGVSEDQLARIHAPIGLELNAETPHEIAVSVLAEIIMIQHGGDGRPMRWQDARTAQAETPSS